MATIVEQLNGAKPYENPAYKLACQLAEMQERGASWAEVKAMSGEIDRAVSAGRKEDRAIAEAISTLSEAEPIALATVPLGF